MFAVFSEFAVSAPSKATVPVVSVSVTVSALTVAVNVVPPDCVTLNVPMSVPTAPTVTAPVALITRLDAVPAAVPAMEPVPIVVPCSVNVSPSAITILPVETVPPLTESLVPCACSVPVVTLPDAVSAPFRLVAPTPPRAMLVAFTLPRLAVAAVEIAKAPTAPWMPDPTAPFTLTTPPLPAAMDTLCATPLALSTVPPKVTAAPAALAPEFVVSTVMALASATLPAKSMAAPSLT